MKRPAEKKTFLKTVGEFAENDANSPTDTTRITDVLHGRFRDLSEAR